MNGFSQSRLNTFAWAPALLLGLSSAHAQTSTPSEAAAPAEKASGRSSVTGLAPVVVSSRKFLDADTSGITNLPLPLTKVPQSITLVNNDFVKAADLKNMGEIAQYTTGAQWASYSPSYGNQVWLRGFAAGYAIDGLMVGDQITEPDAATLERYEVVKGPASVVYGAQSPGGVINLVSKSASAGTPNYVQAVAGSWGRLRLEGQAAGALNASGSLRGIGVVAQDQGGSFVNHVDLHKSVVYGGLDYDGGDGTTAYVRGSYQRTRDTPYNGVPTYADGTLVPVARDFFLGGSRLEAEAKAYRLDAGVSWAPADQWVIDLKAVGQHTTHGGANAYNYDYIAKDGSFPIGGEQFNRWHVDDLTLSAAATRHLDDWGLENSSWSANLRYQTYRYNIDESFLTGAPANLYAGEDAVNNAFNALSLSGGGYQQDQKMHYLTASTQAVIQVAEPLMLVGGAAYSKPVVDLQVNRGAWQSLDPGSQINYRAAAIWEPTETLNVYASYSESFQPNLRLDTAFQVLPPVRGRQVEVGAKFAPTRDFLLSGSLYEIRESNVAIYDSMVDGESLYRSSNVRHRGAELDATGQLAPGWQVKGGVAVLDAVITHDPAHPVNDGERQPWLPRVTANLFTSYTFRNGWSISGGGRYVDAVRTYDRSAPTVTPALRSYVVADAGVGYAVDQWSFQLNAQNLFNKHYRVSTPIFQSLSAGLYPGEPRSYAVSVRRDF
jgi:iron complex outermembrane receptor protein